MNESHREEFKEKMIYNAFVAQERVWESRQHFGGMMLPDTESRAEFEEVVREEVKKIEDAANVVTAVTVEGEAVHVAIMVGESVDEEIIQDMVERMNHRVYQYATDRGRE